MLLAVPVSHPFERSPSQSPYPDAQTDSQRPPKHCGRVLGLLTLHTWPQAPQFAMSLAIDTSHPSALLRLQSSKPAEQDREHAPDRHTPSALIEPAHRTPQRPQFCASVARSASHPLLELASQSAVAEAHSQPQTPARQYGVLLGGVGHARSQPPQCRTSVRGSVQVIEQRVPVGPLQPLTQMYRPDTS